MRLTRILSVLFFLSGIPALVYQLVWQRALFRIFGVNIESVTVVVTAFMLGLGLGSLAGGWLSTRRNLKLLPLLAAMEIAIGLFGLQSLAIFAFVGDRVVGLPLAAIATVTLALVVVPTVLMGATLPLLVAHLVRHTRNVGDSVGVLYYANTLGAGAACLLAAVVLFPFLGLQGSIYVAAGFNFTVAIGALLAHVLTRNASPGPSPAAMPAGTSSADRSRMAFPAVLTLSFLSGYVSLSYEIFFFRVVSFMTGSNAITFTVTLGAFLVGLAGGAREGGRLCLQDVPPASAAPKVLRALVFANLSALAMLPILSHVGFLGESMVGVALLLAYFIGKKWGGFLPFLAHRGVSAESSTGPHLSYLYLANILGSAAGAILTGFVLMNVLGMRALAMTLAAFGLGFVVLAAVSLHLPPSARRREVLTAVVATLALFALHQPLTSNLIEVLQWHEAVQEHGRFVQVAENRSGVVTVDASRSVYGHGMYDGHFNVDLLHDTNGIWRAYALDLYHPAPRRVLIIGLSSGSWAQVIANAPGVEQVTIVEINPAYADLIASQPDIASVLRNPKVTLVIDDGRRWLSANPTLRFDAVVSNTAIHFRANASNVLSVEFQELVRRHLAPGGTLFYNTTDSLRVMRTGCRVFPYGVRLANFMVVSDQPIDLLQERWRTALLLWHVDGKPAIDQSRPADLSELNRLLAIPKTMGDATLVAERKVAEDCTSILSRTTGRMLITDDNMGTEWRHRLRLEE